MMSRFLVSIFLLSYLPVYSITILELYNRNPDLFVLKRGMSGQQNVLNLTNWGITSLEGITEIPVCAQVQFLHLQRNCLQSLPHGWLKAFPNLEGLYLFANRLQGLTPEMFEGCPTLVELLMHANAISEITPGLLGQLTALRYLSLRGNSLLAIRLSDFSASPLAILKLDGCPLESVTLDAQLPELTDLYIKLPPNQPKHSDLFSQCPKLSHLSEGLCLLEL